MPDEKNKQKSIYEDENLLSGELKAFGVKKVLYQLAGESANGSKFDCHTQAHKIGRTAWKLFGQSVFEEGSSLCHSGVYHGAMESFINERGTEDLISKIDLLCSNFKTHFGVFQCIHGAGHGILAYLNYDLPLALVECQKIKDGWKVTSCYDGAFMENVVMGRDTETGKATHQTLWLNKQDPQFPCNAVDKDVDVQRHCYRMQTSWMINLFNADYDKVISECLKSPDNVVSWCFRGIGRDFAGNTLRKSSEIINFCQKVPKSYDYREQCITGAVQVSVDFWGPNLKNQATDLCKLILDQNLKKTCYSVLAERVLQIFNSDEERNAICKDFEIPFKSFCTNTI